MNTSKLKLQKSLRRSKTLFSEIKQEFSKKQENINKTFKFKDYISKNECTSFLFGKEKIDQKGYICFKCDKKGKNFICDYCYKTCHVKCRDSSKENEESFIKIEFFKIQNFACYCGVKLKHTFEIIQNTKKNSCTMMQLDQVLEIPPYHCVSHNCMVCCICAVVCHKNCKFEKIIDINEGLDCECNSNFHSNFNELALSFPLEQYKKVANVDIWPIQILNILFSSKSTFSKMSLLFHRILNGEIDFKNPNNIPVINKFESLLELFSDSFNRKFKTYYYVEEMNNMFPFEKLFNFIKNFEVNNGQTAIINFRLLFILLFMHLRKDFNTLKSFTSNDFYCNTVLERLKLKKILKSDIIFSYNINDKYKLNEDSPVKTFVLKSLCNLITEGMNYVSVEENQDEFQIGLKLIGFMLKRMIFDKNDIILLIDSIYDFHSKFYFYIMHEKNNIYSLIEIFNKIVEICFIISIYYNDLIIEEYLEQKNINKIGNFIHTKSEHTNKLLTILIKNCDVFSKHYKLLIKPFLNKKTKEEIRRDNIFRRHKLAIQSQILSRTTGITTKMPENGGLFTEKIINLFIENLSIFSLADNIYQKQLNNITNDDIDDYYKFCRKLEDKQFYEIMNMEQGKHHSNILYNLKVVIEEIYFNLFTTSYVNNKDTLEKELRSSLLNACDEIYNNIEIFKSKTYYQKILNKFKKKEKKNKKKENYIISDEEILKRKILKEISSNVNFVKSDFLLIEEGRELIVSNLIVSQIDEILFKGMFLLSNIHYPNIINVELIELFFHFLSLFFLTKGGTIYLITGKTLQVLQRLINRFRFDEKKKNIKIDKNRIAEFNINSIKIVIHFLYNLTKLIKIYSIKTIKGHKVLMKFKRSILTHLKYFSDNITNEEIELEFKRQLKESLEIFNNLFPFYSYNEFEIVKTDIIELFKNNHLKFLNSEAFQNLFNKSIFSKNNTYVKLRNNEIEYYFQFFELVTKNSYYIYKNDEYGKKLIYSILEFIDIQLLEKILYESSDMMSYSQKIILLQFIRTFYLIDYLNPVNYLYKEHLLSNSDYKYMINNDFIKEKKIIEYLDIPKNHSISVGNNKERKKFIKKYEYINQLIILLNIFGEQIDEFPHSIYNETNISIKNYIKELIFSVHEISNFIYYNHDISNKILPYYHRLVIKFMNRKDVFLKILNDIDNDIERINPNDYNYLIITENRNQDYKFITNNKFIIFNVKELFIRTINNIYEIYNKTKINKEYSLQSYLEIFDIFNEANFPPFSLLEIKDYEYFYEENDNDKNKENKNNNNDEINKLDIVNNNFLEQFRNISLTSFLGLLTGDSTDKKIDFAFNFTFLFESFINSTESGNIKYYRTLICILNKMLFYDCAHVQSIFREMICDKYFFKNINRELNYYIVKYIDSSEKYELTKICTEIADITKLTIQFLQLLGEGFNTDFHENILKNLSEKRRLIKKRTLIRKGTLFHKDNLINENEKEIESSSEYTSSDDEKLIINEEIIEKSVQFALKQEKNNIKKVPLIEPEYSIYESMIYNLKIIFHLMELNDIVEGELSFDKLILLSSNIIDFLIEYIDTKPSFIDIVDINITNLFFGKKRKKIKKNKRQNIFTFIKNSGISQLFVMRIKDNEYKENLKNIEDNEEEGKNNYNKYKLRKTILCYMKIKYFQLLKAYIQLGKKKDFIQQLLENKLGPIKLFEEAIFYMGELINNLVNKDFNKYNYLLKVENINSYKNKLEYLYMYEDDFRTSIEINLIFEICIIIKILEDIYDITMLKEHYNKIQFKDTIKIKNHKNKTNENIKENLNEKKANEKNNLIDNNSNKNKNENKKKDIIIKGNPEYDNKNTNYNNIITNNNVSNTITPFKSKLTYFSTINNINTNDNINNTNNIETKNNIITLRENPKLKKFKKEEELNRNLYENISNFYKKYIKAKLKKENEKKLLQNKIPKLSIDELNINSKFSIAVYKFIFSLILKVEIQSDIEINSFKWKNKLMIRKLCTQKISDEITKNIINFKNNDDFLSQRDANENFDLFEENLKKLERKEYKVKSFEEEIEVNKITFFIKPYLSFHLSEETKENFLNKVDRSSTKGKYSSLITFSDYSVFEMMYNMKFINKSEFLKKLSKTPFIYLHIINYILIIIENALLMVHYYRNYSLSYDEYNDTKIVINQKLIDIIIIIIFKFVIILFACFVWFYSKFILEYQKNIIFQKEKTFIFRKAEEKNQNINEPILVEYFQGKGSLFKMLKLINKDIDIISKLKILICDTILFNLDINIFIFSFLLNILFLILGNPIILSIETLFIVSIFPSLLNIFKSFTAKSSSIFACLIFNYLIVYVYAWITIFNMRQTLNFDDFYDYKTGQNIEEQFCHSSIQCLLILISYGTRAGDTGDNISYKSGVNIFIGKFIYDMTFFIFVIMIMGSVTFGLIIDTFGELRDESYNNEYDKNNICFICQISKDGCLIKNIDFHTHIKHEHNLWNYVYFLIYLHLFNPNDFSKIEGIVWDKLIENDYGWIPIDKGTDKEEDEEN